MNNISELSEFGWHIEDDNPKDFDWNFSLKTPGKIFDLLLKFAKNSDCGIQ
jgi:hypothetical protein